METNEGLGCAQLQQSLWHSLHSYQGAGLGGPPATVSKATGQRSKDCEMMVCNLDVCHPIVDTSLESYGSRISSSCISGLRSRN